MTRLRRLGIVVLILVTLIMVILSVSQVLFPAPPASPPAAAPELRFTAYDETPLSGSLFQLSAARRSIVVVNFWRADCAPCREQAAALERLWQQGQSKGVIVVGLNLGDETPDALRFINELGLTYLIGPDAGAIAQAYAVQTLPTTVVVGPDGTLAWSKSGAVAQAELENIIAQLTAP
jgi:peroxiredoxin